MIVRIWRGAADHDKAEAYHDHVTRRVFSALTKIPGHRGAYLLRRETGVRVEFLAITLWESMAAVKAFAGANPDIAVVEPDAHTVLAEYDDFVRHFELAFAGPCPGP
jgi:heme-degrading monooxygenase HmoA